MKKSRFTEHQIAYALRHAELMSALCVDFRIDFNV